MERVVRELFAAFEAIDSERYEAMWADEARLEYPVGIPGTPEVVEGKAAIMAAQRRAFIGIKARTIHELRIHELASGSGAVVEFHMHQELAAGPALTAWFLVILGIKDRRITLMREYYDSRVIAEAVAALPAGA